MANADAAETSLQDSLHLVLSTSGPSHLNPGKCIICQKDNKKCQSLQGGEAGRKRVREVAELKHDVVYKRLHILGPDFEFKYHNTYACYKQYTDKRKLEDTGEQPHETVSDDTVEEPESINNASTRSANISRPPPSANINPIYLKCTICASDRIQLKGKRVREKFRLCEEESAQKFIRAMTFRRDDVWVRCADLDAPDKIFAADIYCHKSCLTQYVDLPKDPDLEKKQLTMNPISRYELFKKALRSLDPLLGDGYGLTVTEIREFMLSLSDNKNEQLYNRDVKKYLLDHYGEKIQFCPSTRANESEMCFSSSISIEDIAKKMRNMDVVKNCGEILRQELRNVDFKLDDKFCDGNELKESWENTQMPDQLLTFFSALFGTKRSRMLKFEIIDMTNQDVLPDIDNDDDNPDFTTEYNQQNQLNCLFQIMYYQLFKGIKKTPLHVSFGQYQYGKSRSRELLTVSNRIGVSTSYNDVKRSRHLLAAYAVQKSLGNEIPIPSTFAGDCFTFGAMDNADFSDKSSISGMQSDHVTMQVLYQEIVSPPSSKPRLSEAKLQRNKVCLPDILPCQRVPYHPKPTIKPSLPTDFKPLDGEVANFVADSVSALNEADKREFLIAFIRCGIRKKTGETDDSNTVCTWAGFHSLVSTAAIPLSRVGYLPMIPSPVTDYATVRKALQNFQSVRRQLNPSQSIFPVFCDEGVFHSVADILMAEPDTFADIHGMMGMFHWVKVLLKCVGRYLRGSGIEDGLIETEVFGKLTLNSVLEGTHYVRSFQGICIVSDAIHRLMWEGFWLWISRHGRDIDDGLMECAVQLRETLCMKSSSNSSVKFQELLAKCGDLQLMFKSFVDDCNSKSEMCQYWTVFQQMALIIKHVVSSDREGNFALHMAAVEKSLPIFLESDCINYLRYGSFYHETTKLLQTTHPEIYHHFVRGHFVVKDHVGSFNAVAPDMKLEQSIQRASKSKGGIVGHVKNTSAVVEWQLIFHEILLISNNLRELTKDNSMDHSEVANVHHDLTGQKAGNFNRNVGLLLDFMSTRGNPFVIEVPGIKLHNFVTKELAEDEVSIRLRDIIVNGERCYKDFHKERFIDKNKKLSVTISKRSLPTLDYKSSSESPTCALVVSQKILADAQRHVDIMKQRGMSLESIYSHDLLPSSIIFEGDLASKPDKSKLMVEIEKALVPEDLVFPGGTAAVIVDFMSRIRSFTSLASFQTFGNAIRTVLSTGASLCQRSSLHVVFDSYLDSSVKGGERTRRCSGKGAVDMAVITADVPVPQQMDKFWPSSSNKTALQHLTRAIAAQQDLQIPIILSGSVVDEEVVPAVLICPRRSSNESSLPQNIDALTGTVEEADDRLLLHCAWEVTRGCDRLLVISNDTDTVVRLLHFIHEWRDHGLKELWVEFGHGERRRHLPLHTIADRVGLKMCQVLVKVHVLTGDDALSKIGSKHAAYTCEPDQYLHNFAESDDLTEDSCEMVEEYLVRVWTGAGRKTLCKTFDHARYESHINSHHPKPLQLLPPTSSVIRSHIKRAFFILRNVLNVLNAQYTVPDATNYGWLSEDDTMLPVKGLKPLPPEMLIVCQCRGDCDTRRCICRRGGISCVVFCHASQNSECRNDC